MLSNMRLADTCGVNNLHGMPALLSAVFSAIYASLATTESYGASLTSIFPAMKPMAPVMNTTMTNETSGELHEFVAGVR